MTNKTHLDQHLLETTLEEQVVYRGKMLTLRQDRVRLSDGKEATREFVVHPGASCIVPLLPNNQIVMVKQFRYSVGKIFIELPAGKLSVGELPLDTARRELEEETGYRAKDWQALGSCHPCIGYGNEIIYYFVANGLTQHEAHPDEGEWVDTLILDVAEVFEMVDRGEITDSKSLAGLLLAKQKGLI